MTMGQDLMRRHGMSPFAAFVQSAEFAQHAERIHADIQRAINRLFGWNSMTEQPEWKSTVLRCFDDPDHCKVCAFIAGDRSAETMLHVIERLDAALADEELHARRVLDALIVGK